MILISFHINNKMTFSIGQDVIDIEIKALNLLKKSIRKSQFEMAVNCLYKTLENYNLWNR